MSTAPVEGPDWSSRAQAWVEHWAAMADPRARRAAGRGGSYRFENRFRYVVAAR